MSDDTDDCVMSDFMRDESRFIYYYYNNSIIIYLYNNINSIIYLYKENFILSYSGDEVFLSIECIVHIFKSRS